MLIDVSFSRLVLQLETMDELPWWYTDLLDNMATCEAEIAEVKDKLNRHK